MTRGVARPVSLAAFALLGAACASGGLDRQAAVKDAPSWPAGEPRVRLEATLSTRKDVGAAGLLARLAGTSDEIVFSRPYGVAWDGEDLLVADPAAGRVLRLVARGGLATTAEGVLEEPTGIAVCEAGVVVSEPRAGRVTLLRKDLRLVRRLVEGASRPTGVTCSGTRIWIAETGAHRLLSLDGESAPRALGGRGEGPGEFNFPTVVACRNGRLLVGDSLNFRVQVLEASSAKFERTFGRIGDAAGEMPRLKGIAVDADGDIWVSDAILDQVMLYDAAGSFLTAIGGPGRGPGEFQFPAGLSASGAGRVAVADSLNRRVQIFRLIPRNGGTR